MPSYTSEPLEHRLQAAALAWLDSLSATFELRAQDEDTEITAKTETPKRLRLIVEAIDEGRHIQGAPIRNMRLALTIRGNTHTDAGKVDPMKEAAALIEALLDETNLLTALDSAALGVRVMHAVRRPGSGTNTQGMIRRTRYEVECKAVRAELTTA